MRPTREDGRRAAHLFAVSFVIYTGAYFGWLLHTGDVERLAWEVAGIATVAAGAGIGLLARRNLR